MNLHFFLGGRDLEMVTIAELLEEFAPGRYTDHRLTWGALASVYRNEILEVLALGCRPVLVEVADDLGLDPTRVIIVDHHGDRGGEERPTSLHQVFSLLRLPLLAWTRWFDLVVANDRGHVTGLLQAGATPDEVRAIRARDRTAQGITLVEEEAGERAAQAARPYACGRLLVVDLPHGRTATVTDRLHAALGGPGYDNLLIYSPGEVNFYGSGDLVLLLDRRVPGGWHGGDLPTRGYWGHRSGVQLVLPILLEAMDGRRGTLL